MNNSSADTKAFKLLKYGLDTGYPHLLLISLATVDRRLSWPEHTVA